jgi:hypothetical protein
MDTAKSEPAGMRPQRFELEAVGMWKCLHVAVVGFAKKESAVAVG